MPRSGPCSCLGRAAAKSNRVRPKLVCLERSLARGRDFGVFHQATVIMGMCSLCSFEAGSGYTWVGNHMSHGFGPR